MSSSPNNVFIVSSVIAGPPGKQGIPGTGITWLGTWSAATAYTIGSGVARNGSGYFALQPTTGVDPSTDNGTNWSIIVQGGASFLTGNGAPASTLGIVGDSYIDVNGDILYNKTGSGWGTGTQLSDLVCQTTTAWTMPAVGSVVSNVPVTSTAWAQVGSIALINTGLGLEFMQVTAVGTGVVSLQNLGGTISSATVVVGATVELVGLAGVTSTQATNVQVYTGQAISYTIPNNAQILDVIAIGAGGGGGSGRVGAASSARSGGGGGGGGGYSRERFSVSILGGGGTVIQGQAGVGGTGGVAVSAIDTNGNAGGAGGDSWFGGANTANALLVARGGGGGGGGSTTVSTVGGGANGQFAGSAGGAGQSASNGTGGSGVGAGYGAAGAGGAGGISAAEVVFAGGAGGVIPIAVKVDTAPTGGVVQGGAGAAGHASGQYQPGGAGAGGGASNTNGTPGGTGGNGGNYGGAGGGGGAGTDSVSNSGAGGNGANGVVIVVALF